MKVLITIDTELWPGSGSWPVARPSIDDLHAAHQHCVLGSTPDGDFGIPRLLEDLARHDLKAIFFVEPLFAAAGGTRLLSETVGAIQASSQDVQLHLHTEWLAHASHPRLPRKSRQNLSEFDRRQQRSIMARGIELLECAGADAVVAVRAGNLCGNDTTTRVAGELGLRYDFSSVGCPSTMDVGPAGVDACMRVPVSCIGYGSAGQFRPVQLGSLSTGELSNALMRHAGAGREYFCILLHSFELVRRTPRGTRVNWINLARWRRLCELLSARRELFRTVHCNEIDGEQLARQEHKVLSGRALDLPRRYVEQAISRVW